MSKLVPKQLNKEEIHNEKNSFSKYNYSNGFICTE